LTSDIDDISYLVNNKLRN